MTTKTTDLAVGQVWGKAEAPGRQAVAITDLLPNGAVAFMHVTNGTRDRVPSHAAFRAQFPRLMGGARTVAAQAAEVTKAVPDDF